MRDGLQRWIRPQFGAEGDLILEDTAFPQPGQPAMGVARQSPGTLGQVARCPVAVTWPRATQREALGLDARLYLPQAWAEDSQRCPKSGLPAEVRDQPQWPWARALLERAPAHGLRGSVLADRWFGTVTAGRAQWETAGGKCCGGVDATLIVIAAATD